MDRGPWINCGLAAVGKVKLGCCVQGGIGSVDTGVVVRSPMVSGWIQVKPLFIRSAHLLYILLTLGFPYIARHSQLLTVVLVNLCIYHTGAGYSIHNQIGYLLVRGFILSLIMGEGSYDQSLLRFPAILYCATI
jgi:hypothetical protein